MTSKAQIGGLIFLSFLIVTFAVDTPLIWALREAGGNLRTIGSALSSLGNSAWMFNTLLVWAFVSAIIAQSSATQENRRNARLLLKLAVILFAAILISGICVQILKHFFGRARPVFFEELGAFSFNPLAFDMNLNSFPSGHATSIGAVTMIGALFLPNYRVLFAIIALVVGAARIADEAHYLSDILAGLTLGAGTSYLLVRALTTFGVIPAPGSEDWKAIGVMLKRWYGSAVKGPVRENTTADIVLLRLTVAVLAAFTLSLVVFISIPEIDIAISDLFFSPDAGFSYSKVPALNVFRKMYWFSTLLVFFAALILCCAAIRLRESVEVHWAIWGFVASAFLIGPGLVANSLFKTYWGRARPADIIEFGGTAQFTLPFEFANECARNCSFVSGEGSGIAMLFLVVVALGWPMFRKAPMLWLSPMAAVAVFGIAMRIMKGRHFLSDTLFAILLMALVILVLYRIFEIGRHRNALTEHGLKHDAAVMWGYVSAPFSTSRSLLRDIWRVGIALRSVGRAVMEVSIATRQALMNSVRTTRARLNA